MPDNTVPGRRRPGRVTDGGRAHERARPTGGRTRERARSGGDRTRPGTGRRGPGALHIAVAITSTVVLLVTGLAWHSVDALESNLATARLGLGGAKDGALDLLLVGTDSRTDAHGNPLSPTELAALHAGDAEADNTDTIILVRIPNNGESATAISIPRDSYVAVPGIGMSKINAAFGATKLTEKQRLLDAGTDPTTAETKAIQAGREALIDSVADLTGVTVDHYAEIGLLGFVLLTDAVGGVEVCLNNPVDEPLSGARFPAGQQTLSGAEALSFVRQRHDLPRGDLDRIVRQQAFMASLVHRMLSAKTLSNPGSLGQMTSAVQRSVVLDADWDVIGFARELQHLAGGQVRFQTIPVVDLNATTDYGESIVQVDPKAVRAFVADLAGEHSDEVTGAAPTVDPSTVTVNVANAGGIGGLANRVSESLSAKGFRIGSVGNHTGGPVSSSQVRAADPGSAAAASVAAALDGVDVTADRSLPSDTVLVVLAEDYTGPGTGSSAAPTRGSGASSDIVENSEPTPVAPGPPIDAGRTGPQCVN